MLNTLNFDTQLGNWINFINYFEEIIFIKEIMVNLKKNKKKGVEVFNFAPYNKIKSHFFILNYIQQWRQKIRNSI